MNLFSLITQHWIISLFVLAIIIYYLYKWIVSPRVVEPLMRLDTFRETLSVMTDADIVQAMIDGLKRKWVNIDMYSFGRIGYEVCGNTLHGCAATNIECQIMGNVFPEAMIDSPANRASYLGLTKTVQKCSITSETVLDLDYLQDFEFAINMLRQGKVEDYNRFAKRIDIPLLAWPNEPLPSLGDNPTWLQLRKWQRYANWLETRNLD